ncbi:hypothetical protein IB211_01260c [Intestinimonas butyriciproducens]|uniref:Uncharacterized protein n=1 Tax=Intestinimonas butyriciproducens TaxID=1297617 RepID=A0A0S2W2S5_9FIRM|nr:hypothetical protein IB211_01260c [Intestinimonas butyriciproducens]
MQSARTYTFAPHYIHILFFVNCLIVCDRWFCHFFEFLLTVQTISDIVTV